MKRFVVSVIVCCVSMVGLIGCPGNTPPPTPTCSTVSLGAASALPLAELVVSGVPEEIDELTATAAPASGGESVPVYIERNASGDVVLTTPIHPADPIGGGGVTIQIAAGELSCPAVTLSIQPMPDAAGAFAAAIDQVQSLIDLHTGFFDVSTEALLSTEPTTLPPNLVPVIVAQSILDDPASPTALRAIAETGDATIGGDALDIDLLNRVTALVGLADLAEADTQDLSEILNPTPTTTARPDRRQTFTSLSRVAINNAETLNRYMSLAGRSSMDVTAGTATNKVLGDMGKAVGLLAVVPHPGAKAASAATGALLFAYQKTREGMANLFPSAFVDGSLTFEYAPDAYVEDEGFESNPGSWSNVMVSATSTGWRLDRTVIESMLQVAGLIGGYSAWLDRFAPAGWEDDLVGFVFNDVMNELLNLVDESGTGQNDVLEIEPQKWGPIDVTGEPWTVGEALGDAILVDSASLSYEPIATGAASLLVRTGDGLFGGAEASKAETVTVTELVVTLSPESMRVDPGQTIEFAATVDNAVDQGLDWTAEPNAGSFASAFSFGDGPHENAYQTPTDESDYPITIAATSSSTGGLRGRSDAPPRFDSVVLSAGLDVIVTPSDVCLRAGESLTFTAEVIGSENQQVNWSGDAGAIAADGTFAAPSADGQFMVAATSVEDPTASGGATVEVGACECTWQATLSGDYNAVLDGAVAQATFIESPLGSSFALSLEESLSTVGNIVTINVAQPAPGRGDTGAFDNVTISAIDGVSFFAGGGEESPTQLVITFNDFGRIEGYFTGSLAGPDPTDVTASRTVNISGAFRGAEDTVLNIGCSGE